MTALLKNPKTTLLGLLLGLLYGLAAVISKSGAISAADITTAIVPIVLGALTADPTSFTERFLLHWRTTLGGLVVAAGSLIGNEISVGRFDLKSLGTALIIAAAGILMKDGDRGGRQPDIRAIGARSDPGRLQ